ncbi:class I SAM-dependent methyltransferase [Gracilibacillus sp. YIM 98692]|uniref:class I SAM-dependent DNA methyltransferase n=1 Tax=Gracilibacillus sp. YIM 98692 TaxID=2663532 RepID=UPI0013D49F54|nr:class I SAM-dependent methyltransferase [Gracilibacillus sp. YIM 98692]
MAYAKLAYIYDLLMEDAPYNDWQAFVSHFIHQHQPNAKTMLDLGCGTGEMSIRFNQTGFEVTGIDYSSDMLAYAHSRSVEQQSNVTYIKQDIRQLGDVGTFDVIISLCDVLNYITEERDVLAVIQHVANCLEEGGLFIFDVHSLQHFQNNMIGETFAEIYDDISYVWFCEPSGRTGEVIHDLTFFVLDEDSGLYERFDEKHQQRTFSVDFYRELLKEAGLQLRSIHTDFSINHHNEPESGERIFFVCSK